MELVPRRLADRVLHALDANPVVFVNGPRQSGKSTLVRVLSRDSFPAEYVTLDNASQMSAAASSPASFLSSRDAAMIIDEVQLVPDLFRALKEVVDERRMDYPDARNARYLLTGSADIMTLPGLADALVGRMSIQTLYPFAVCEVERTPGRFLERIFERDYSGLGASRFDPVEAIARATYPELVERDDRDRAEWIESYLTTILQRDVRNISEIEKIPVLPRLLRVLASRAGSLLNDAAIARDVGLNPVTCAKYRSLLNAVFLTFDLSPWHRNIGKRLVKSAKGFLGDTLVLCHLLGRSVAEMRERAPELFGHVVENFVATELRKLLAFGDVRAELFHFRTSSHQEVDFVLERPDGSVAAVEVKSRADVSAADFDGIRTLEAAVGDQFVAGVVLYSGKAVVPFGANLHALPLSALWL